MITPLEALAVIDGALCQVDRTGERAIRHAPLATAVVEFRNGPLRTYVREHPYGLLPGIPNLYCLDGASRIQWMAEWPAVDDPCAVIVGEEEEDDALIVMSVSGARVKLDASTGRLISWQQKVEAAG